MPGAEASGQAFLGLISQLKERGHSEELERILAEADPMVREVFRTRIAVMSWHPYQAYVGFLRTVDRAIGRDDGQLIRELGLGAGQRDLSSIWRVLRSIASPERLIRSCTRVWKSYYRNAGRMEALEWSPEKTVLRIYDFPEMDPLHCRLMEWWMVSAMESIGCLVNDDARETECASLGGRYHEFSCSWRRM